MAAVAASMTLIVVALVIMWVGRVIADRPLYVSELGGEGEPTAPSFTVALFCVAAAGLLTAPLFGSSASTWRVMAVIPIAHVCAASGLCFAVAAAVHCTKGCVLPVGPDFTWRNLVHISFAVLGFAAACLAMLQTASSSLPRSMRMLSAIGCCVVSVVALLGAALSVLGIAGDVGGLCEFIATTVGLTWLACSSWVLRSVPTSADGDDMRSRAVEISRL